MMRTVCAAVVTVEFSADITDIVDIVPGTNPPPSIETVSVSSIPGSSITTDSTVTGSFTYNTSGAVPGNSNQNYAAYTAPLSISLSIHTTTEVLTTSFMGTGYFSVIDTTADGILTRFQFGNGAPSYGGPNFSFTPALAGEEATWAQFTLDSLTETDSGNHLAMPTDIVDAGAYSHKDVIISLGHEGSWTGTGIEYAIYTNFTSFSTTVVPIPPSAYLFGSGLLGLIRIARRKKALNCHRDAPSGAVSYCRE